MSAAWWQVVINRLVASLPTLPGWSTVSIFDGPPVTGDAPRDYVTVGFVSGEAFAGTYDRLRGEANLVEETGTIRSELVCLTGDVDLPTVRARAFALADAWEAWVEADQTLGVLGPSATASLAVDVAPAQTTEGAEQRLVLTLTYFSRS